MTAKVKDDLMGTAAQIVYEYPGWGCEHVSDMYDCSMHSNQYSYDDLEDACYVIQKFKNEGVTYNDSINKGIATL